MSPGTKRRNLRPFFTVIMVLLLVGLSAGAALAGLPTQNNNTPTQQAESSSGKPQTSKTGGNDKVSKPESVAAPYVILYDQYDNQATTAPIDVTSQDFEAANDAFDTFVADDFVVPAGQTWSINGVDVDGEYAGNPAGPAASVNVFFYNDAGTLPGTSVASRPGQAYTGTAGDFVITISPAVSLPAGTYWVSVQARQDFSTAGQWFWHNRTVQSNNGSAFQNPGNGFGTGCTTWVRKSACAGLNNPTPDQVFRINGTLAGGSTATTTNTVIAGTATATSVPGVSICNPTPITINDAGPASPYPSNIIVAGLGGTVTDVNVQLNGLNHTWPDDIDMLLVGPGGQTAVIFSDAGGSTDIVAATVVLDDEAATQLPDPGPITSGTYRPANYEGVDAFPAPAPAPGTSELLSVFDGTSPNGIWSLYIVDDTGADAGNVSGGWCLVISTAGGATSTSTGTVAPSTTRTGTTTSTSTAANTATVTQTRTASATPNPCQNYGVTSGTGVIVPGTTDTGNHGDDVVTTINLPFSYTFYDTPYTAANVSSNGNIQFASTSTSFINTCLPSATLDNTIYAYWDDLRTDDTTGVTGIFTSITGAAPNRVFNIEWRACVRVGPAVCTSVDTNFEVKLYEGQTRFDVVYGVLGGPAGNQNGGSATTGVELNAGRFTQYSCNQAVLTPGQQLTYVLPSAGCATGTVGTTATGTGTTVSTSTTTRTTTTTATTTRTTTVTMVAGTSTTTGTPGVGVTICNPTPITINDAGPASPYPSNIIVAGLGGTVTDVNVQLNGLNHTWPDDIDMLLVGPGGQTAVIFSDAGGSLDIVAANVTLDDEAATQLPDSGQISSGSYRPANYEPGTDNFPAPAPAPGTNELLSVFDGTSPNGTWSLYIVDDTGADVGSVSGGWCLVISTSGGTVTGTPPTGTSTRTNTVLATSTRTVTAGSVTATVCVPGGGTPGPFRTSTPGPTMRYRHGGATDGTNIYVYGGGDSTGAVLNTAWRWAAATETWTQLANMPTAKQNIQGAYWAGKIYVPGGFTGAAHITELAIYDIATNTWTTGTPLPSAQSGQTAAWNGRIYNIGGNPGPQTTVRYYDVSAGTWNTAAPLPVANTYGRAITAGNFIYYVGGIAGSTTNTVYRLDPAADTWTTMAPLQTARTSTELATNGTKIFAMGGGDATFFTGVPLAQSVEIYDIASNTWTYGPPLVQKVAAPAGGGVASGKIMIMGGVDNTTYPTTVQVSDVTGGGGCTPTPGGTSTVIASATRTTTGTAVATGTVCATQTVITGSITAGDTTHGDALTDDQVPSTCAVPGTCSQLGLADIFNYDTHTFTNSTGSAQCVTITLDGSQCQVAAGDKAAGKPDTGRGKDSSNGGLGVFSAAYLNSFNPANLCQNYLGDIAANTVGQGTYSVTVPAGSTLVVVVEEFQSTSGCVLYSLGVSGLGGGNCGTPTAGTAVPTITAGMTSTVVASPTACVIGYTISAATGTIIPATNDIGNHIDDGVTQITLPFPVTIYGQSYTSALAGSNGTLQFSQVSQKAFFVDQCFPQIAEEGVPFENTLFLFYDDLRTDEDPATHGIYTATIGNAPNRQFVVRWKVTYFNLVGEEAEFEAVFTEGSPNFSVIYGASADSGQLAAAGIQRNDLDFEEYSCNTPNLTAGLRLNYTASGGCGTGTPTVGTTSTVQATVTTVASVTRTSTPVNTVVNTVVPSMTAVNTVVPSGTPVNTVVPSGTAMNTTVPTSTTVPATQTRTTVPVATATVCPIQFADVPTSDTFYAPIRCLVCRYIISGYQCGGSNPQTGQPEPCNAQNQGYFRTGNDVVRGQIAKMVSNSAGFQEAPGAQIYQDVPTTDTFYAFINRLSRRGYMGGYPCGGPGEPCVNNRPYFRPYASATRGQVAKIVSNGAGFSEPRTGQSFTDVPTNSTFYLFIERLYARGVVTGVACGGVNPQTGQAEPCDTQNRPYFRPNNRITRGQTAQIVARSFFPNCVTP